MRSLLLLCVFCFSGLILNAQSATEHPGVHQACMNYINGFYQGDSTLLAESMRPRLNKLGFWQNEDGSFKFYGYMTFEEAKIFAQEVSESGRQPAPKAPKTVEILHVGHTIAVAKITAWWGIDYLTLSREGNKWMIEQALWEGPLNRK